MANIKVEEKSHVATKHYELAAGLILPGVFGAELVFLFQILTHDMAIDFGTQPTAWIWLKYLLGSWFVLYVCTSFMVTVTNTVKSAYGPLSLAVDSLEAVFSFVALAFLGFVDVEVTSVYASRFDVPLGVAFGAICLIAATGALHSSAKNIWQVVVARWIGAIVGGAAALAFFVHAKIHSYLSDTQILVVGFAATILCFAGLAAYFYGRWITKKQR